MSDADPGDEKPFPLALAAEGERVRVVALAAGRSLERRVADLGLHPGVVIEVRQRQRGGLVVARDGARIALGAGVATRILVLPVGP